MRGGEEEREMGGESTLASSIDHLDKTHSVVDNQLFAIGIFYCGVVCLGEGKGVVRWDDWVIGRMHTSVG